MLRSILVLKALTIYKPTIVGRTSGHISILPRKTERGGTHGEDVVSSDNIHGKFTPKRLELRFILAYDLCIK